MHAVIDLKQLAAEVEEKTGDGQALAPPPARRLGELVLAVGNDKAELLRHRYLCQGAGLLIVGPTGIGKSSLEMQMMILWALGREAFGIQPARPLKSLLVQAENDDGDLVEMRDGVIRGLELSREDAAAACDRIIVVREDSRTGVGFFAGTLRPLVTEHRPDLVWIDPALSYLGGEASSQKDVGASCETCSTRCCGSSAVAVWWYTIRTSRQADGRDRTGRRATSPTWAAGQSSGQAGRAASWPCGASARTASLN
jgi:RecA-family ATPase